MTELGVAGDWELCHTSLANFTQAAEDMVECKEVSTNIFEAIFCFVFHFDKIWFQSCPDPGIRPPPIQFDNSEFYGFSEFW